LSWSPGTTRQHSKGAYAQKKTAAITFPQKRLLIEYSFWNDDVETLNDLAAVAGPGRTRARLAERSRHNICVQNLNTTAGVHCDDPAITNKQDH
jgi:hypothetical protein